MPVGSPSARWAVFAAALALAGVQGALAFNYHWGNSRDVSATISTDGNAYVGTSQSASCSSISPVIGGTCTLTVVNKGTSAVRYWLNETSDPCGIGSTTRTDSGSMPIVVGNQWPFGLSIAARLSGGTCDIFYELDANNPAHLSHVDMSGFKVVITYA